MFDFVPLEYYTAIHYHVLLAISLLILCTAMVYKLDNLNNLLLLDFIGYSLLIGLTLYMGLRPISGRYFGDTGSYAFSYKLLKEGKVWIIDKDYLFDYLMLACSKWMDVHRFFLLLDILYITPCFVFAKKYFGRYWFFGFLLFITSFSFWSYGTNGLRNGLGTAFFILALCFYKSKRWLMYFFFALAYFMHASLVIPLFAFVVSGLYKTPKAYLYIWLAAIPLSLAGGSAWTTFFASLGFAEDRTQGYLVGGEESMSQFSQTGFRWDFLLYSAATIFAGWYFIFKKKITDRFYIHLFGTYCIANAFWILVITAAFSNRFAYLSWFLMPAVIGYPMLRYRLWKDQYKVIGIVILAYFMFTYVMNVIK